MTTTVKFAAAAIMALSMLAAPVFAAIKKPQTQAEIDCWNGATNDYFDQIKECAKVLSDDTGQLQQCNDDAKADRDRAHNNCVKAARTGKRGTTGVGAGGKPPAVKAP